MNQKSPQNSVTEPEIQQEITVFTSLWPAVAGAVAKRHVSRQPSNSRGRKGTFKSPRRIQASDRREVRNAILHHFAGWKGCSSLSLRGVAADRRKAGAAFELQPDQEKVLEPHQLLRPGGGDGWTGAGAGSGAAGRIGRHLRGRGRCGPLNASGKADKPGRPAGLLLGPADGLGL